MDLAPEWGPGRDKVLPRRCSEGHREGRYAPHPERQGRCERGESSQEVPGSLTVLAASCRLLLERRGFGDKEQARRPGS